MERKYRIPLLNCFGKMGINFIYNCYLSTDKTSTDLVIIDEKAKDLWKCLIPNKGL